MKKLLIVSIIAICAIALRMPEVATALGIASSQEPASAPVLHTRAVQAQQKPMTAEEFAKLAQTDPHVYQKYLNSHPVQPVERSEIDKLMNWLARGKYE